MSSDFKSRLTEALTARTPTKTRQVGARQAAVLIPIVGAPEPTVIFTRRTDTLSSHKGQISFPGGSIDPTDASARHAALRETQEEIGLDPAIVDVVGELDTFPTYVTGYVVTPFVGWIQATPELTPNAAEVAAILHVPLAELTESIRVEPGFSHKDTTYPTEAWGWNDQVIWGVTARIIRLLLHRLADAELADRPVGDPWWKLPSASGGPPA